jgi:hypothetical protein
MQACPPAGLSPNTQHFLLAVNLLNHPKTEKSEKVNISITQKRHTD